MRGRKALEAKKLLRENLADFELRGVLRRGHDRPVTVPERIANPVYQGQFWSDDCEIGLQTLGQSDKPWNIGGIRRQAPRLPFDAPVSWRTPDLLTSPARLRLPHQRVLPSPPPDTPHHHLYTPS